MPGPDLILPGFYGKLPLAGDFVTRRLPPEFVRFWDRWASRHLAPRLADATPLFFILAQGPAARRRRRGRERRPGRPALPAHARRRAPSHPSRAAGNRRTLVRRTRRSGPRRRRGRPRSRRPRRASHGPAPSRRSAGAPRPPPLQLWTAARAPAAPSTPKPPARRSTRSSPRRRRPADADLEPDRLSATSSPWRWTRRATSTSCSSSRAPSTSPTSARRPGPRLGDPGSPRHGRRVHRRPGFSATLWETDFAFRKPRCDIVLNGAAYAPGARPADRVRVGLKVGAWSKVFDVLGHREWRARGPLFAATSPEPFLRRPFSYDTAWGGTDRLDPDDTLPASYPRNPIGTGWSRPRNQRLIPGLALPTTQAVGEEITSPFGDYTPMSFGPMGRGWPGRIEYGGTYDQNWIDNIFPFLPARLRRPLLPDGPARPADRPPRGGEEVILANLTPQGKENFRLPPTALPVTLFKPAATRRLEADLLPDTLLFDPENRRFSLAWRVSSRIHRTSSTSPRPGSGPPPRPCSAPAAKAAPTIRAAGALSARRARTHDRPARHRLPRHGHRRRPRRPLRLRRHARPPRRLPGDPLPRPRGDWILGAPVPAAAQPGVGAEAPGAPGSPAPSASAFDACPDLPRGAVPLFLCVAEATAPAGSTASTPLAGRRDGRARLQLQPHRAARRLRPPLAAPSPSTRPAS